MKHQMAMTKNMRRFLQATDDLLNRPQGTEGMGLLWGRPGEGKTTSVAYVTNVYEGIFVRAKGCWTVTSMLHDICVELGWPKDKRMQRRSDMVDYIVAQLSGEGHAPRPIFVDEADYCFQQFAMIDSLRDIYDLSGCPVILIGMEDIAKMIRSKGLIARRITQWIEFTGLDQADTALVASQCCEIDLHEDMVQHLHRETGANVGRIIIGLTKIEQFAKLNNLDHLTLSQWGDRPLYFDQPNFGRKTAKGVA